MQALLSVMMAGMNAIFGAANANTTILVGSFGIYYKIQHSVAVQGILQSLGYAIRPLIISLLRLVIFVFPVAYLFTLTDNVINIVWWTFSIAEILTAVISVFILKKSYTEKIETIIK